MTLLLPPPLPLPGLRASGGRRWLSCQMVPLPLSVFLHLPQPDSMPTVTREAG